MTLIWRYCNVTRMHTTNYKLLRWWTYDISSHLTPNQFSGVEALLRNNPHTPGTVSNKARVQALWTDMTARWSNINITRRTVMSCGWFKTPWHLCDAALRKLRERRWNMKTKKKYSFNEKLCEKSKSNKFKKLSKIYLNRYKQRVLAPGHQGWNDLHSLCRIGMEYYLLNDNNDDDDDDDDDDNNDNNNNNNNNNNDDNDNDNMIIMIIIITIMIIIRMMMIIIIIMIITTIMIIMMMPRDVSSQMWHSLQ